MNRPRRARAAVVLAVTAVAGSALAVATAPVASATTVCVITSDDRSGPDWEGYCVYLPVNVPPIG